MTVSVDTLRQKTDRFLRGPLYIWALALLTTLTFAFGGEILFYCAIALLAGYICAFSDDLLPLAPLFALVYIAPSVRSNPGRSSDSIFSGNSLIFVVIVGALIIGCFVYRIIRDRKLYFRRGNKLMSGMLILCGAYMISGIGSAGYLDVAGKNLLFALGQCAGILLPYWLIVNGVNWEKARKDYLPWIGMAMGCVLLAEIFCIYLINPVLKNGIIYREEIYTGWGMRNNLGCMLAMAIPFAFSIGVHYKKTVLGILGGAVFLAGVFMTTSRTSAIFGGLAYVGCIALMFLYTEDRKKKLIALLVVLGMGVALLAALHKPLLRLFSQTLDDAHELDSRFDIYKRGLKTFFNTPIFGSTFYPTAENPAWGWAQNDVRSILPDRWHNTVVQLLASTGIVGFAAYCFHRFQTIRMALAFRGREKWLVVFSALIMLLCSLLDCHLFNVGPTLFYSMSLAFMEKQE